MKTILITAAGTATGWHIGNVAKNFFNNKVQIVACDTNPVEFVPCRSIVRKTYQVPRSDDPSYVNVISSIVEKEHVDVIIPLIPREAYLFYRGSEFINKYDIFTPIPSLKAVKCLSDKKELFDFLTKEEIPTPKVFEMDDIDKRAKYILKPRLGFGSVGVEICSGAEIRHKLNETFLDNSCIVQEYCHGDDYEEVTVEIFNTPSRLEIFARKRLDVKSGVCVKMCPVDEKPFIGYIKKIVKDAECPVAFNVQFLRDNGNWKLFDFNLRLPAGTALSSAIGFQLTRALITVAIGEEPVDDLFQVDKTAKGVLRAYKEIVVR